MSFRKIIEGVDLLAGKAVSNEREEIIIDEIIKDKIPKNSSSVKVLTPMIGHVMDFKSLV